MIIDIEILETYLKSLKIYYNLKVYKILYKDDRHIYFNCEYKLKNNSEDIHMNIFTVDINDIKKCVRLNKLKDIL